MRAPFSVILFFVLTQFLLGQTPPLSFNDTLVMMNGELIPCQITDSTLYGAKIKVKNKKGEIRDVLVEGERIFSLRFANGREKIVYKPNATEDDIFTVEEARLFIIGERDAKKGFRTLPVDIGGAVVGVASGSVGTMLSLLPPFAYSGLMLIPKVRIKHKTVSDINYLKNDTYILGYERVARKKKALNSFKTGMAGVAVGLLINQFVIK